MIPTSEARLKACRVSGTVTAVAAADTSSPAPSQRPKRWGRGAFSSWSRPLTSALRAGTRKSMAAVAAKESWKEGRAKAGGSTERIINAASAKSVEGNFARSPQIATIARQLMTMARKTGIFSPARKP